MHLRSHSRLPQAVLAVVICLWGGAASAGTSSMTQDAYVWQRVWNQPVRESVMRHSADFETMVVLAAEVSWQKKQPQVIHVPLDVAALAHKRLGLALRINPYPGSTSEQAAAAAFLADLAAALVAEAKTNGLNPCELQLDFDCAESKLEGYRVWVQAIRRKIAPVPLTITVLPCWLNQKDMFRKLVAATDGYVLQVHSLEPPKDTQSSFTLCDPAAAKRAVERAGEFDVPFRVALPTYGYVIAFDQRGKFVGLSAEGPRRSWAKDIQLRETRANPGELAELVRSWMDNPPVLMRGIIWYRLPVLDDALNWRWPTLAAVMAGRSPREHVRVSVKKPMPELLEISLENDGELDVTSRFRVGLSWHDVRLVAGDGLRGFSLTDDERFGAHLQNDRQPLRVPAGETKNIGWIRLSGGSEVQNTLIKINDTKSTELTPGAKKMFNHTPQ